MIGGAGMLAGSRSATRPQRDLIDGAEGWQAAHPVIDRYAELRRIAHESAGQRMRSILSAVTRMPVSVRRRDSRFFGLIARLRMTFLMTLEELAVFKRARSLQKSRKGFTSLPLEQDSFRFRHLESGKGQDATAPAISR
jgi:hypothetical protein